MCPIAFFCTSRKQECVFSITIEQAHPSFSNPGRNRNRFQLAIKSYKQNGESPMPPCKLDFICNQSKTMQHHSDLTLPDSNCIDLNKSSPLSPLVDIGGLKHGQMASNRCWAQAAMVSGSTKSDQNKDETHKTRMHSIVKLITIDIGQTQIKQCLFSVA
jgi:hypothetical protein